MAQFVPVAIHLQVVVVLALVGHLVVFSDYFHVVSEDLEAEAVLCIRMVNLK